MATDPRRKASPQILDRVRSHAYATLTPQTAAVHHLGVVPRILAQGRDAEARRSQDQGAGGFRPRLRGPDARRELRPPVPLPVPLDEGRLAPPHGGGDVPARGRRRRAAAAVLPRAARAAGGAPEHLCQVRLVEGRALPLARRRQPVRAAVDEPDQQPAPRRGHRVRVSHPAPQVRVPGLEHLRALLQRHDRFDRLPRREHRQLGRRRHRLPDAGHRVGDEGAPAVDAHHDQQSHERRQPAVRPHQQPRFAVGSVRRQLLGRHAQPSGRRCSTA